MSQMAHEVVGAKLVFGVSAESLEIGFPPRQLRPPQRRERGVTLHPGDRCAEQDQVSALLDWHHIGLVGRRLSAGVDLTVGLRIHADVVRGKWELPARRSAVDQGRCDESLRECRPHQQKLRRGGIDHVNRGNAAVAAVFLREQEWLFVGVGCEAAARESLAVGERRRCVRNALRRSVRDQPSTPRQNPHSALPGVRNRVRRRAADRPEWPRRAASMA